MIVKKKDLSIVINEINQKKRAIIFGKGKSFKIVDKCEEDLFMCINETLNYIDNCDILVCNDIETFDRINKERLLKVKIIIIPYHIHKNSKPSITLNYNEVLKYLDGYEGKIIVYNLSTINIYYDNFIELSTRNTSSHTGLEFLCRYSSIKNVICYGIGNINASGYHDNFEITKPIIDCPYTYSRIKSIRDSMIEISKQYKINLSLN